MDGPIRPGVDPVGQFDQDPWRRLDRRLRVILMYLFAFLLSCPSLAVREMSTVSRRCEKERKDGSPSILDFLALAIFRPWLEFGIEKELLTDGSCY
jgi:hypothetical protein